MSQTSGRHLAGRPRRRPSRRALAVVIPLVLVLVGGSAAAYRIVGRSDSGPSCDAGSVTLQVVADPDQAALLQAAARDFVATEPVVNGRCVDVDVRDLDSPEAMAALASGWTGASSGPRPDVWVPASSTWGTQLELQLQAANQRDLIPDERPSVATSPLVIAMPRPMAEALGWPQRKLGWSDLVGALRNPAGWSAFRHPEWGPFKLGKTDPKLSEAGLGALLGGIVTAAGPGRLDPEALRSRSTELGGLLLEISRSPGDETDTTTTFLSNLRRADEQGEALDYVSAVPLTEKAVWDYNRGAVADSPSNDGPRGQPKVPLAAVYPKEGTLQADYPWLVLRGSWVDEDKRAAANDLLLHLKSPKVQAAFQARGFRSARGAPGSALTNADGLLAADQPSRVMASPPAPVVAAALRGWDQTKRIANLISVYDVSGSMAEPVPGTGATKLELAKRAAISALRLFTSESRLGVWEFSTNLDGRRDYRQVLAPGALGSRGPGGKTYLELTEASLRKLTPTRGDTGLYDTTLAAYRYIQRNYVPERLNLVVLITDGRNDDPSGGISLSQLLDRLREGQQDERKVRIITFAYGQDADRAVLQRIAKATGGAFFASPNPTDIQRVFVTALANF